MRGRLDETLRKPRESTPQRDKDLSRHRGAGALAAALCRFPTLDIDAFYESNVLLEPGRVILVQGDCPTTVADLTVFVAPPPADGGSLLRRIFRDHTAEHEATIRRLTQALDDYAALETYGRETFGGLAPLLLAQPNAMELLRSTVTSSARSRAESSPAHAHRSLVPGTPPRGTTARPTHRPQRPLGR